MQKDKNGRYIILHSVVATECGSLYCVVGFDNSREYSVELANGCTKCYDNPSKLTVVTDL